MVTDSAISTGGVSIINENLLFILIITFFLGISMFLYCLLGGADFGAGILELFLGKSRREEKRKIITSALGPVWEANHIWLILVVVILFNGFPGAFYPLFICLHLPLTILLIGIIFRGCSFTFRHYDAVKDQSQRYYTIIFSLSSLLTPFMLGVIGGALILGRIPSQTASYSITYLLPWVDWFPFSLGFFVCCLFAFVAAVYMTGETTDPGLKKSFARSAKIGGFLSVLAGICIFGIAALEHLPWIEKFLTNPLSITCIICSIFLFLPLWYSMKTSRLWLCRIFVSAQVGLVLLGWFSIQYPIIVQMNPSSITIYQAAAPTATLRQLFYALLVGSGLIFPALAYLLKIFKSKPQKGSFLYRASEKQNEHL